MRKQNCGRPFVLRSIHYAAAFRSNLEAISSMARSNMADMALAGVKVLELEGTDLKTFYDKNCMAW